MAKSKKNDIVHSPLVTYASMISLLILCPPFVILPVNGFQGFVDLWPKPTLLTCEIIVAYGVFEAVLQLILPGRTSVCILFGTPVARGDASVALWVKWRGKWLLVSDVQGPTGHYQH
ncbi:7-dehydrocholesterol reductase-like [Vicia villosa]|uniref:7-dehydrocholesterol reductase-like n=1 Tax=Vicia villosa TaxID=3911 RepID=UPI00273C7732|nr:7-dehydrocholesterol reductase-like [Vicia villosa]